MNALLECSNVTLGYEGSIVTEGINFSVNEGDYLYILGENGSGKSTLIKALLNLKSQMSGEINTSGGLGRNEIGYLPQQTVVQRDFPASVKEIVRSGCVTRSGIRPFFSSSEKKLAADIMNRLDIQNLASRCYRELSGGQQQRVLLARALCAARKLLLLDEPVTGLDPKASNEMYELIADLNKNDGITIIMVSHDINAAVKYASHILHIGSTQLFFGKKKDYLKSKVGRSFIEITEDE
ncbi:MAG: metal ABC transporter ATP-binding protein [Ruminococcus sp.]|nr:metal ABC transporter ATP-binding protein [Ruminococcus sp.]